MPNRSVHVVTSGLAGGVFAYHKASGQPQPYVGFEVLGGVIGGYCGGRLPDIIDPPTSPRHRGRAHSVTVGGAVIRVSSDTLNQWQIFCRTQADACAPRATEAVPGSAPAYLWALASVGWRVLAGLIAGLLAGVLMHLVLDGLTPASMNLV